ncbi:MAG: DUF1015 family protein, partial [Oscillospiraceae bacterium]|nr:DUF1015 family protein [Oscillospiraceae bacterium]
AFAVGDGNHSLATAKAWWEEIKPGLTPQQQQNHPARFCLVELVNVHSPAIEIEPIHRVVFGAEPKQFLQAAKDFYEQNDCTVAKNGEHQFTVYTDKEELHFGVNNPKWPLAVGSIEAFLDTYCAAHTEVKVDYIHGIEAVKQLAQKGNIGIVLPDFEKGDLFKGVVMGGVLPRKTFSMGHAEEKRYYMECRKITE